MRATPKLTRYTLAEASRALLDAAPPTVGPAARAGLAAPRRAALAAAEARTVLAPPRRRTASRRPSRPRATGLDLDTRKAAKAGARAAAAAGDRRLADCLDARQLSLKMCANATYGYTGSDVSSLEGKPLAEACVRWGNAYCRRAIALVEDGTFPGARVVYSQTDSVFVVLPGRGHADAADEGRRIAAHVSRNLPEALTLEYEHALRPFILLHVNRYGGCTADGSMLLKGVASQRSCAFRRLGEFVPSLVSRGCKGDAQRDGGDQETLVNETPVDLRLYYDKKLRPELERLLAPFAGDPAVKALFALRVARRAGQREDAKALFQGAAASSTAAPPSPPRAQTLRDRFLLAGPGKDDRCVRCERPTDDAARGVCGPCFGRAGAAYLDLLACQRALDREVCALRRARDAAARAGAVPAGAVSDHAPRLCAAPPGSRAVDAKLGRAFDAPPEASPPPPPPPRKKKRQRPPRGPRRLAARPKKAAKNAKAAPPRTP
ncbi:hypothetical protein JL720_6934 [Aureococcus anophagefferens]|nr:hypothetical protein JL720_6934 [Aureococcus anophagefferens]